MQKKLKGVVHGRMIELDEEPGIPDGQAVSVTVDAAAPPNDQAIFEAFKRAAGGWAEDVEGLDEFLEWNRQQRKVGRREISQ